MKGKIIPVAANLVSQDYLHRQKLENLERRKKDKEQRKVPRGLDSCFGNYPVHVPSKKMQAIKYFQCDKPGGLQIQSVQPIEGRPPAPKRRNPKDAETKLKEYEENKHPRHSNFLQRGDGIGGLNFHISRAVQSAWSARTEREKAGIGSMRENAVDILYEKDVSIKRRPIQPSVFRRFYDRGDIPCQIHHGGSINRLAWKANIKDLHFSHYISLFASGLREPDDPYRFISVQGMYDLMEGCDDPDSMLKVIPLLILPFKKALNTRRLEIVGTVLKVLQVFILSCRAVGEALVPYYRQLLPIFSLYMNKFKYTGDRMDYGQRHREDIGELVKETVEMMEISGGEDAFVNIKYMIPTYQSIIYTV